MSLINGILWMSVDARAVTYEFDLDEDDSFTWEITELNPHQFEKVFGFEPNFEKNDEIKYTIQRIDDTGDGWSLTIEFWDFKIDKDDNGTIKITGPYQNVTLWYIEHPEPSENNSFLNEHYVLVGSTGFLAVSLIFAAIFKNRKKEADNQTNKTYVTSNPQHVEGGQ